MKFWSLALIGAVAAYSVSDGANARSVTNSAKHTIKQMRMPVKGLTQAPIGHVRFCFHHPEECQPITVRETVVSLTGRRWAELTSINTHINKTVQPVSDDLQYGTIEHWTYPSSGKGDCEDYVLLKKRRLIQLGWPPAALLITVVRDENDEGHAVLTVRTNRGELILDNKNSKIKNWQDTPYTFIKRQSSYNPGNWKTVVPHYDIPALAVSGSDR